MNSPPIEHPSAEQLQAFVFGTLSLAEVTAVEEHLTDCSKCQHSVEQVPVTDDPFVRQLAQADAIAQRQRPGSQNLEGTIVLPARSSSSTAPPAARPQSEINIEALRFRVDLMSGLGPSIEDRLLSFAEDARPDLLRRLLIVEMEERIRANQPVLVNDYLRRFTDTSLIERAYEQALSRLAREAAAERHLTELFPKPFDAVGRFREYLFQMKVGEGGMGAVYKALHTRLERAVAFKVLSPDKMQSPEMIARFHREMKAVGKLEHPNIVRAHDAGDHAGCHFLVMEFVDGVPLDVLLKRRGPLPVREACEIIRQAAIGLDYAHRNGLVHRDVKPSNLMIAGVATGGSPVARKSVASNTSLPPTAVIAPPSTATTTGEPPVATADRPALPDTDSMIHNCMETVVAPTDDKSAEAKTATSSRSSWTFRDPPRVPDDSLEPSAALSMREMAPTVKVLDLGLARLQSESNELTHESQVVGTLDYIAPEQARRGSDVDHRADIYSLGCTLFTLLAGRAPFADAGHASIAQKIMAHVEEPLPSLKMLRPDVPPRVVDILQRMTAKQPGQRFQSASAVAEALTPLAQGANLRVLDNSDESAVASTLIFGHSQAALMSGTTIERTASTARRRGTIVGGIALLVVLAVGFAIRSRIGDVVAPSENQPAANQNQNQNQKTAEANVLASPSRDLADRDEMPLELRLIDDSYEWSEPINLGEVVNSKSSEEHPYVGHAGRALVFMRGNREVWLSTRGDVDQPFGPPERLPEPVNLGHRIHSPFLSDDGLTLIVGSAQPGSKGESDLWMFRRSAIDKPFEGPLEIGAEINTSQEDSSVCLSSDGLTLWFATNRASGNLDLWTATRSRLDEPFRDPQPLPGPVNHPQQFDFFPRLVGDGRALLFTTTDLDRRNHVMLCTRPDVQSDFGQPVELSRKLSVGQIGAITVADRSTLIFDSLRPGGHGGSDLWMIRRVKKSSPRPPIVENYELQFVPATLVEVDSLKLDPTGSHTQEAWVTPDMPEIKNSTHVFGQLQASSLFLDNSSGGWGFGLSLADGFRHVASKPIERNQRVHVAIVRADRVMRLFVNGQVASRRGESGRPFSSPSQRFLIANFFTGAMDEIRISSVARYEQDFTPQAHFEPDAHTLALFHCDERSGAVLKDSSGHDCHGRIVGPATWQRSGDGLTIADLLTSPDYEWSPLEDLGEPINTPSYEAGPNIAADGLSLLFHANERRPNPGGKLRIWQAWRHAVNDPFHKPVLLDEVINSQPEDLSDPTITADGLTLAFCMKRDDGQGAFDLWISDRVGGDASWNAPVNAGPTVNSTRSEWEPELSANGLALLFHSDRANENGGTDLWIARRDSRNKPFGSAENLGPDLNTASDEGGAALSSDGLTLLFHRFSTKPTGQLTYWQATRKSVSEPFSKPQPLAVPGLVENRGVSLNLSAAGDRLYCSMVPRDSSPQIGVSRRVLKWNAPPRK